VGPGRNPGQELDNILANWITGRHEIEERFRENKDADERNAKLAHLNEYIELQLIGIAKGLDEMGKGSIGGLPYRIARSRYHAQLFNEMRNALGIGNIESWTSYDQFANRGLKPVFDFIEAVGHRLRQLRQRLANVMQSIQTSALVTQSEETRKNTRALELLQRSAKNITFAALVGIWIAAIGPLKTLSAAVVGACASPSQPAGLSHLLSACELHSKFIGADENAAFLAYLGVLAAVLLLFGLYIALRGDKDPLADRP
jgi:hypothetical protein